MIIYLLFIFSLFLINERFFDKNKNIVIFVALSFLSPILFYVDLGLGLEALQSSVFERISIVSFLVLNSGYLLYQIIEKKDVQLRLPKENFVVLALVLVSYLYLKMFIVLFMLFKNDFSTNNKSVVISKRLLVYLCLFSFLLTSMDSAKLYVSVIAIVMISGDYLTRKKTYFNLLVYFLALDIIHLDSTAGGLFLYGFLCFLLMFSISENLQENHKALLNIILKKYNVVERILTIIILKYNKNIVIKDKEHSPLPIKRKLLKTKYLDHTVDKNLGYITLLSLLCLVLVLGVIK